MTNKLDLAGWSLKELNELEKQIRRAKLAALDKAKAMMRDYAKDLGFSMSELFERKRRQPKQLTLNEVHKGLQGLTKQRKPSPPVKYRNPDNYEETWSGMGRWPKWLREKVGSKHRDPNPAERKIIEKYRI